MYVLKTHFEVNQVRKICLITSRSYLATCKLLESCIPIWYVNRENHITKKARECELNLFVSVNNIKQLNKFFSNIFLRL